MKRYILLIIAIFGFVLTAPDISRAASSLDTNTDLELNLKESQKTGISDTPINKPISPNDDGLLPQAGELVLTFLFVLIGLNILLLLLGIVMFRKAFKKYSYDYGVYS